MSAKAIVLTVLIVIFLLLVVIDGLSAFVLTKEYPKCIFCL